MTSLHSVHIERRKNKHEEDNKQWENKMNTHTHNTFSPMICLVFSLWHNNRNSLCVNGCHMLCDGNSFT